MTVLDATKKLWLWFSQNNTFSLRRIKDLCLIGETPEDTYAAIRIALKDMEALNMIASATVADEEIWVIRKEFSSYEQTVVISAPLAQAISEITNVLTGESSSNPGNIQQEDIDIVVSFCADCLKKVSNDENS